MKTRSLPLFPAMMLTPLAGARPAPTVAADDVLKPASAAMIRQAAEDQAGREGKGHVHPLAFPAGSADGAQIANLTARAYTLQISGANNSTGVTLAEAYEVP